MSPINTTINELNDFNVNINKKLNELFLENTSFILNLLNALPSYILILDSNRQIVFANQNLNDFVDVSLGKELGQRIGDVLGCIHSKEKATGCGTSESCQLCGANNVVLKCQSDDTKFKGECRILAKKITK